MLKINFVNGELLFDPDEESPNARLIGSDEDYCNYKDEGGELIEDEEREFVFSHSCGGYSYLKLDVSCQNADSGFDGSFKYFPSLEEIKPFIQKKNLDLFDKCESSNWGELPC